MKMTTVIISKMAKKQMRKISNEILESAFEWILIVEEIGIESARKRGGNGLHDEPLKGELKGLRSIRLNRAWRLYYKEVDGIPKIISIERIDKHEY
jgi:proteic killer suppression protein